MHAATHRVLIVTFLTTKIVQISAVRIIQVIDSEEMTSSRAS